MFNLKLFARLADPSVISPEALRLFLGLVTKIDLRRPHVIDTYVLTTCFPAELGISLPTLRGYLHHLCQARVLEKCGRFNQVGREWNVTLYQVREEWWLTTDEIAKEIEQQEEWKGREALFERDPSLAEQKFTSELGLGEMEHESLGAEAAQEKV